MSDLNFITFTNKGYVDYTRNLLISNKKNDVNENIKVYALDEYSHNFFSDLHDKVELYKKIKIKNVTRNFLKEEKLEFNQIFLVKKNKC